MELSYGQLEVTLTAHFGIHPDKVGTFRSRIKQLQRLQFPPGVNVGRGEKMKYSAEHLFQLVTAFHLIGLGMPGATATRIVAEFWPQFAAGYATASDDYFQTPPNPIFARVMHRSMRDLSGPPGQRAPETQIFIEDGESLEPILARNSDRGSYGYALLCVSDIFESISQTLNKVAQVTDMAVFDEEFYGWGGKPEFFVFYYRACGAYKLGADPSIPCPPMPTNDSDPEA